MHRRTVECSVRISVNTDGCINSADATGEDYSRVQIVLHPVPLEHVCRSYASYTDPLCLTSTPHNASCFNFLTPNSNWAKSLLGMTVLRKC